MPAREWMEKYESIKEELACRIAPDVYFTVEKIGKMNVDVLEIGEVRFPTGTVFACDPIMGMANMPPYIRSIPAGTYPVRICVVPSGKYGKEAGGYLQTRRVMDVRGGRGR